MAFYQLTRLAHLRQPLAALLSGQAALAFLPAMTLVAFWLGGELALITASAALPLLYLAGQRFGDRLALPRDAVSGMLQRSTFEELTEQVFQRAKAQGRSSATFFISLEEFDKITERYGHGAADLIARQSGERLISVLRDDDSIGKMGEARFAICRPQCASLILSFVSSLRGGFRLYWKNLSPSMG